MKNPDLEFIFNNIVGEIDAIKLYEDALMKTGDSEVISVLSDIRDEEMVHLGELIFLALRIDPENATKFIDGCNEANDLLQKMADESYNAENEQERQEQEREKDLNDRNVKPDKVTKFVKIIKKKKQTI